MAEEVKIVHRRRLSAYILLVLVFLLAAAPMAAGCVLAKQPTAPPAGGTAGTGGAGPAVIGQSAPSGLLSPLAAGETARRFPETFVGRAVMLSFFSTG
jgi:hypothetical protein